MSDNAPESRDIAGLKFDGGRFDQKGFPLDAGDVLKAYRRLVLKAAKLLWKEENPGRRLPNGFEQEFHLGMVKSFDGSTVPVIEAQLPDTNEANPRAERAVDLVNEAFWEIVSHIDISTVKTAFLLDDEILAFNRAFGDDEVVEFRQSTSQGFRVDAVARERIRSALKKKVVQLPGTIIGKLHTISTDGGFVLRTPGGTSVSGKFEGAQRFEQLKSLTTTADEGDWVWIEGDIKLQRGSAEGLGFGVARDFGVFGSGSSSTIRRLSQLSIERLLKLGTSIPIELLQFARDLSTASIDRVSDAGSPGIYLGADADEVEGGGVRLEWVSRVAHLSVDVTDELISGFSYVELDGNLPVFGEDISGMPVLLQKLGDI